MSSDDRYVTVGAAAWLVGALVQRGNVAEARRVFDAVLPLEREIDNPASRADALLLLWEAAYFLGPEAREAALAPLMNDAREARTWKTAWALAQIVCKAAHEDRAEAESIVASIPACPAKDQSLRALQRGEFYPVERHW